MVLRVERRELDKSRDEVCCRDVMYARVRTSKVFDVGLSCLGGDT